LGIIAAACVSKGMVVKGMDFAGKKVRC